MGASKKVVAFQGITGGALGLAVLAIVGSIVGFNSESFFHDDKLGIQFGMIVDATTQEISVWIQVPRTLFIKSTIANILKYEDEGGNGGVEAGLGDLFPVGGTTYGGGVVNVEIYDVDDDVMPDLSKHDQTIVPMAYIRTESQFPIVLRWIMLFGSYVLNNWTIIKVGIFGSAVGCILLGFGWRYMNKRARGDMVEELKEDVA